MSRFLLLLLAATMVVVGCGGGGFIFAGPRIRMVNADSALTAVNGEVGGIRILGAARFGEYSSYVEVAEQSPLVRYTQPGTGQQIYSQRETFDLRGHYTIVDIAGAGNSLEALTFLDDRSSPPAGQAAIRIINASPQLAATMDVYLTDAPSAEPVSPTGTAAFRAATANLPIGPGQVEVQVKRHSDAAVVYDATVPVAAGEIKTVVLVDKTSSSAGGVVLTDKL